MMLTPFTSDEILDIANSLEDYHKVFYTFFDLSNVYYCETNDIPTACVRFYPDKKPEIIVNREFWNSLYHRTRLWVICHECLHVMLLHDERIGSEIEGATFQQINIAQDITINEMSVDLFGFNREEIQDWKKYCWIDTCFKFPQVVKKNETFLYYLELLVNEKKEDLPELLDVHGAQTSRSGSTIGDQMSESVKQKIQEIAEKLAEDLTPEELETMIQSVPESSIAGTVTGMYESVIEKKIKRKKINFDKIIKNLKRSRIKVSEADKESFRSEDRRFADVIKQSKAILPGTTEIEVPSKDRLLTAIFLDVSGSCVHLLSEFNKIYAAFDAQRDIFDLRSFLFDTKVTEFKPGERVHVGGGTKFVIIDQKISELKTEYNRNPDCIIVITDGEASDGEQFSPESPKNWIWLLTPNPEYRYLPVNSKKFLISDVIL